MDINSIDNGKFAVIKTSKEFILVIDEEFIGPFPITKEKILLVYKTLKN